MFGSDVSTIGPFCVPKRVIFEVMRRCSVRAERVLNKEKYYSVIPWGHVRFRRIDVRFGSETWNLQFRLSLSSKNALCSVPYTVWPFKIIKGEPNIPPGDLMSAEGPSNIVLGPLGQTGCPCTAHNIVRGHWPQTGSAVPHPEKTRNFRPWSVRFLLGSCPTDPSFSMLPCEFVHHDDTL